MARKSVAEPPTTSVPATNSLKTVREAARNCQACDLFRNATQTVFGEGTKGARIFLVGEQPGDQEDKQGLPFVGPAGRILKKALEEAGIDLADVYVTNAVKHFKFEERGKRRLHKKPNSVEIGACRMWLLAELELIKPQLIVALGATAALSLASRRMGIEENRGKLLPHPAAEHMLITIHPSAILRAPPEEQKAAYERFASDLKIAADFSSNQRI